MQGFVGVQVNNEQTSKDQAAVTDWDLISLQVRKVGKPELRVLLIGLLQV